jgi:ligand-binding sensor domain-containing protein/signal transduction histidine kinase
LGYSISISTILILSGFLVVDILVAQSRSPYFYSISVEDGLPQSSVNTIAQDKAGYMWFGTQDGLARYDGYEFTIFRNSLTDPNSLCNNFITSLLVTERGSIWIGTSNGLSVYDPLLNEFVSYYHDTSDSLSLNSSTITSLFQDSDGIIYIGTNAGLNKVNHHKSHHAVQFERYRTNPDPGPMEIFSGTVHDITEDGWGRIWIASQGKEADTRADNGALTVFSKTSGRFEHFYHNQGTHTLSSSAIRSLHYRDSNLWAGTINGGLNRISLSSEGNIEQIDHFTHQSDDPYSIPHHYVSKITSGADSDIWIGTYNSLVSLNPRLDLFKNYTNVEEFRSSNSSAINDLYVDTAGNLWVATSNGLFVYYSNRQPFDVEIPDPDAENSILAGDIFGIYEDSRGEVWTLSFGSGINRIEYQPNGQKYIYTYTPLSSAHPSLSSAQLLGVTEDHNQDVWISSFDGLFKIIKTDQPETVNITHFSPERLAINPDIRKYYTQIYTHPNGSLWVETYQNGVDEIHIRDQELVIENHSEITIGDTSHRILAFYMDPDGTSWIVTRDFLGRGLIDENGRLQVTPIFGKQVEWNRIVDLDIKYVMGDQSGRVWAGTSNGLVKLRVDSAPDSNENDHLWADITIYTEADGLSNNTVYAIAGTPDNHLWLSTNRGLSRFSVENEQFTTYELEGGAGINEFNEGAVAYGQGGSLYFGGIGGLVRFHPDSISPNPFVPPIQITGFRVLNNPLPANDSRLIYSESADSLQRLTLSHNDSFFSVSFAALNFNQPGKNQYAYKLHGFHEDWVYSGTQREATFTNLDDGEYLFQVKGSNNDGIWNEAGVSLKIVILPPLWETWYAYSFYLFVIFLAGYLLIRGRIRAATRELEIKSQIEKARHEEREVFRKKSSQDFHDEAGNKITKINLFTELAKSEAAGSPTLKGYLQKIEVNSRELSNGMRDFIWAMDPEKDTLFETLLRLKEFGDSMFTDTGTDFSIEGLSSDTREIQLPMDMRHSILQMFKEAMNNCAKYADANKVVLSVNTFINTLNITLTDDGVGFNPEDAANQEGYGLTIMAERAQKINGNLSIKSKKMNGTRIILLVNIPQMGDTEELKK